MEPLTLSQIERIEAQLEKEISDKRSLLQAYRIVKADLLEGMEAAKARNGSVEQQVPFTDLIPTSKAERPYGENTRVVRFAIANMKENYTVRDLHQFIHDRNGHLSKEAIGIVLARLKENGEITEFQKGSGRRPTLFKKP